MGTKFFREMTQCAQCRATPEGTRLWVSGWRGFHAGNSRLFCNAGCWEAYQQGHKLLQKTGLTFREEEL